MESNSIPLLIVISGCSGVGKDTILLRMKNQSLPYYFAITATSRPKRPGEIDGVDYHFLQRPEFEKMIENDEFFEWAHVYDNLYGVPRKTIAQAMAEGKDAIVKVDIQGAAAIKHLEPKSVSIFLSPPSMEELRQRLVGRHTESEANLELRLQTAYKEMESQDSFDHIVISRNNQIDQAISDIEDIIAAEKIVNNRQVNLYE